MTKIRAKTPRIAIDSESYRHLHRQILEWDNWRCQVCGTMQNLQVHHLQFQGRSGDDGETNLITLCVDCHKQTHGLS